MEWNWARLGAALKAGRKAMRPRVTQPKMGDRIGVSLATIQAIEAGKEFDKVTPTIRAYARELGWADGSVEKVLEGGEPVIQSAQDEPADPGHELAESAAAHLAALPAEVQEALIREGELYDATVLDVDLPDAPGQMIIVVKGKPKVPKEIIARDLRDIATRYLALRGIKPPEDNGDTAAQA